MKRDVFLLLPIYPPARGGAATYGSLLEQNMPKCDSVGKLTILTTTMEDEPFYEKTDNSNILRIIPRKDGNLFFKATLSIFQNLFILISVFLISILKKKPIIHIHSNFFFIGRVCYNYIFDIVIYLIKKLTGASIIMDIRDQFTIPNRTPSVTAIICASENILNQVNNRGWKNIPVTLVPVPIDIERIRNYDDSTSFDKQLPSSYICFVGDIRRNKGVSALVDAVSLMDSEDPIVLVGPIYEEFNSDIGSINEDIIAVGPQPRDKTLQIIDHADLLALPSESEGMPRVCLEAISLKTPVLAPSGIPEFERHIPDKVLSKTNPKELADRLSTNSTSSTSEYPIHQHHITNSIDILCSVYKEV